MIENKNIENKNILIIDANNLFYRYYYRDNETCLKELKNFCTSTDSFYKKVIMIFDSENRTREKFVNSYKANRNKSDDSKKKLKEFENMTKEIAGKPTIKSRLIFLKINGYEADDLVFYLTQKLQNKYKLTLATTDKDYYQFLSPKVNICRKLSMEKDFDYPDYILGQIYSIHNFNIEFNNIDPLTQYPIIKALIGDPSDNIKGLYKVGEKTALKLLAQAPDVKRMYSLISEKYSQEEAKQFLIDYQLIMPLPIKFMSTKDLSYLKRVIKSI